MSSRVSRQGSQGTVAMGSITHPCVAWSGTSRMKPVNVNLRTISNGSHQKNCGR